MPALPLPLYLPIALAPGVPRSPASSGIFSGLVYDSLEKHKKFGPRVVLALGLAANAGGYLGLWAAVTGCARACTSPCIGGKAAGVPQTCGHGVP